MKIKPHLGSLRVVGKARLLAAALERISPHLTRKAEAQRAINSIEVYYPKGMERPEEMPTVAMVINGEANGACLRYTSTAPDNEGNPQQVSRPIKREAAAAWLGEAERIITFCDAEMEPHNAVINDLTIKLRHLGIKPAQAVAHIRG